MSRISDTFSRLLAIPDSHDYVTDMPRTRPVAKYRLRHSVYTSHVESIGLITDSQQAAAFGFSRKTVNDVRNERIQPSSEFMASVCAVLKVRTDAMFEIIRDTAGRAA